MYLKPHGVYFSFSSQISDQNNFLIVMSIRGSLPVTYIALPLSLSLSLSPLQIILLTKTTATQNGVALSYHKVRGLYFLAVVLMRSIHIIFFLVLHLI